MAELSSLWHRVQLSTGIAAAILVLVALVFQPGISQKKLTALEKIQQRGYIRILTLNSASTYYLDIDGPNGFEYQLARWFSESIGVEAGFITVSQFSDLYTELLFGTGDIVAAGLSENESKFSSMVNYGPRYYEVKSQVLYRNNNADKNRPRSIEDIAGASLHILRGSSQSALLHRLKDQHSELVWSEVDDITSDELVERADTGQADYIMADSHDIALQRRFFPELRIAFELGEARQLRWAYNQHEDDSLKMAIDGFFVKIEADGRLEQLIHRHYSHVAKFNYSDIQTFTHHMQTRLPRYQAMFEVAADEVGIDWRLLAAIGYQESLWNARAKSPTGVRGLMMLTQITARQMKVKNRLDAEQSIDGGARYFKSIYNRVPDRITVPDRTWFALASYNVGSGHVEDARKITETQGGDPDKWIDVKKSLPLLARKKWYKGTKYGYARGWEPVKYVENIRQYYEYLIGGEIKANRDSGELEKLAPTEELRIAPSL
ncbi:MAG: membrane-bound lytic murein transglycosylase MltF [Gammaproteobacteria bacterium]|nr:membrane-bound lytic murein transglycosylase MltF [Gammaproteobacteria bacterium]